MNLYCKECENHLIANDKDLAFFKDQWGGVNLIVKNASKKEVALNLILKTSPEKKMLIPRIFICKYCNTKLGSDSRAIDPEGTGESVFCFKDEAIYLIEDSKERYYFDSNHKWKDDFHRFTHIIDNATNDAKNDTRCDLNELSGMFNRIRLASSQRQVKEEEKKCRKLEREIEVKLERDLDYERQKAKLMGKGDFSNWRKTNEPDQTEKGFKKSNGKNRDRYVSRLAEASENMNERKVEKKERRKQGNKFDY